jgi:hypothetical protein
MMFEDPRGPIERYLWGSFVINGEEHTGSGENRKGKGKDIMILSGNVRRWKERQGHILTESMVERVLENGCDILIIGNGAEGALEVPDSVIDYLNDNGVARVMVLKTPDACRAYNELFRKGMDVALLAHGTC